nr:hypothetical protein [Tanacetum cinerariifolium]
EEFCTSSGTSDAGENPPPVTIHTWLEHFNKQKPRSFEKAIAPHFLRLAGFLEAAAGIEEEQAKNFQWGLRRSTLNHLMCMSYTDVAQVANAARNYEILHERDDDDAERPDKRQKSGDRHQPTTQQSSHQSRGPSEGYSYPVCTTCRRRHPGECHRAAGTCFKCGQAGHLQKDCK